jgi:lipopolysaccharide/colanic/teichoic acid biosynthesis glycosyltransferase
MHRPPDVWYERAKRSFDVAFAMLALTLLAPLGMLIAVAIRIDSPGPIVFTQQRTGKDGRRFQMFKFRTMVRDAESLKVEYAHLNVLMPPDFKIPDDPRITPVGRFLRRTSLDELPQLVNILRGDMSFVGPRPTSFADDTYDLWHTARLEVTPGLTGLWQIRARGDVDFDERLRLDIEYIRSRSLVTDLRILSATFISVLRAEGR